MGRDNYDALAGAVAQLLPLLIIVVFVESRIVPSYRQDKFWRFYRPFALGTGWLGTLAALAYLASDMDSGSLETRLFVGLWFVAAGCLLGLLALEARQALSSRHEPQDRSQSGKPSQEYGASPVADLMLTIALSGLALRQWGHSTRVGKPNP